MQSPSRALSHASESSSPLGFPALLLSQLSASKLATNRTFGSNRLQALIRLEQDGVAIASAVADGGFSPGPDRSVATWSAFQAFLALPATDAVSQSYDLHVSVSDVHRLTTDSMPIGSGRQSVSSLLHVAGLSGPRSIVIDIFSTSGVQSGTLQLTVRRAMSSEPRGAGKLATVCGVIMLQVSIVLCHAAVLCVSSFRI